MGRRVKKKIQVFLLVFWIIAILVVMGYPSLKAPHIGNTPIDFAVFFVLGVLEYRLLHPRLFFLLGCVVVITGEIEQLVSPGRSFELLDIAAGALGLLASYLFLKMHGWYREVSKT
jgi:uncharacterized membrane protein